eukprot:TRINITY_DN9567_c0_g1_i6.p2 TRINITY_DN9567_c0_g1~~TRINITY_DN9567_c0_g1_i6.p2  ORF type:complete len:223 (-),score=16.59 TRINITY_DN9567_c0_g1_i6:88-756(-)
MISQRYLAINYCKERILVINFKETDWIGGSNWMTKFGLQPVKKLCIIRSSMKRQASNEELQTSFGIKWIQLVYGKNIQSRVLVLQWMPISYEGDIVGLLKWMDPLISRQIHHMCQQDRPILGTKFQRIWGFWSQRFLFSSGRSVIRTRVRSGIQGENLVECQHWPSKDIMIGKIGILRECQLVIAVLPFIVFVQTHNEVKNGDFVIMFEVVVDFKEQGLQAL